jgi:hypothetical protein
MTENKFSQVPTEYCGRAGPFAKLTSSLREASQTRGSEIGEYLHGLACTSVNSWHHQYSDLARVQYSSMPLL